MSTQYPHQASEVPTEEHFAALVSETTGGYESDGTYTTAPMLQYVVLGNREKCLTWIREQDENARKYSGGQKPFVIVKVTPVGVQRTVNITLDD